MSFLFCFPRPGGARRVTIAHEIITPLLGLGSFVSCLLLFIGFAKVEKLCAHISGGFYLADDFQRFVQTEERAHIWVREIATVFGGQ